MDVNIYKKILKEKGMTYEDLAQKTGLSLGCIKRIMAGIARYPRVDTIEAIENALDISSAITQEERAAGASETKTLKVTPEEFTASERELIKKIRSLRKESRDLVEQMVDTLAGTDNESRKKQA